MRNSPAHGSTGTLRALVPAVGFSCPPSFYFSILVCSANSTAPEFFSRGLSLLLLSEGSHLHYAGVVYCFFCFSQYCSLYSPQTHPITAALELLGVKELEAVSLDPALCSAVHLHQEIQIQQDSASVSCFPMDPIMSFFESVEMKS